MRKRSVAWRVAVEALPTSHLEKGHAANGSFAGRTKTRDGGGGSMNRSCVWLVCASSLISGLLAEENPPLVVWILTGVALGFASNSVDKWIRRGAR